MAAALTLETGNSNIAIPTAPTLPQGIGPHQYQCRATQVTPAWHLLIPGEPVSLDIEFQNFKHTSWEKWRHRVGRVAIVNSKGETVLDVYAAYPKEDGVAKLMPPARFLVSHQDLKFCNGAVPAQKVERWVKQIIKGRTVIVHGGTHDLTAFVMEKDVYARSHVVDMQNEYSYLQWDGTPGLRTAAAAVLGESVQELVHSPVEDAQTTLKLWFQNHSYDRDAEVARMNAEKASSSVKANSNNRKPGGGWSKNKNWRRHQNPRTSRKDQRPDVPNLDEFPALGGAKTVVW